MFESEFPKIKLFEEVFVGVNSKGFYSFVYILDGRHQLVLYIRLQTRCFTLQCEDSRVLFTTAAIWVTVIFGLKILFCFLNLQKTIISNICTLFLKKNS